MLTVKDFVKGRVIEAENLSLENNVFVLESRYHIVAKVSSKIKNWGAISLSSIDENDYRLIPSSEQKPLTKKIVVDPNPDIDTSSSSILTRKRKAPPTPAEDVSHRRLRAQQTVAVLSHPAADHKGFNFQSMPKTTKDLITRLHSQRPLFMIPQPVASHMLPAKVIKAFDDRGDGVVRWFNAPPLDPIGSELGYSKDYLKFKTKESAKKIREVIQEDDDQMEVDPTPPNDDDLLKALQGKKVVHVSAC